MVEAGSLTAAAEGLRVAQPALGLQIRNLEEELGVSLIVRHSRGIEPTPPGRLLFERAVAILQSIDDVKQEIKSFAGTRETIRFGITPSAMRLLGPDLLLEARQIMPDIFFSLVEELSFSLVAALQAGDLDAAFSYQNSERINISSRPLLEEDLLLISSPERDPSSAPISFIDAASRELVLSGPRDVIRRMAEDAAEPLPVPLNVIYEAQSVSATRNLIEKGLASGIMPYGSVVEELNAGQLCGRLIVKPNLVRTLYFLRRTRSAPLHSEEALARFVARMTQTLIERLGERCRPLNVP